MVNSLDTVTLEKSLRVLKPAGQLIFHLRPSRRGVCETHRRVVGLQLRDSGESKALPGNRLVSFHESERRPVTCLIDDGIIRPIVDRVFAFASTKKAMAYVEARTGQGQGRRLLRDTKRAR